MEDYIAKFRKLPSNIQAFFISDMPAFEMKKVFSIYNMSSLLSKNITTEIGLIYVSDFSLQSLPGLIAQKITSSQSVAYGIAYEINRRIFNKFPDYFKDSTDLLEQWARLKSAPLISEDEAWKKVLEAEPWILELEKETQKENQSQQQITRDNLLDLTLVDAIKQFPEIGEQLITSEKINLKNFPEPVRPSLKNWLADYTFTVGHDKHDSIQRGNYLFHSKNTLRLPSADREKLSYILKAYDEQTSIAVNKNSKQIVFSPAASQPSPVSSSQSPTKTLGVPRSMTSGIPNPAYRPLQDNRQQTVNNPPQTIRQNPAISFSSPQKLPYEKLKSQQYKVKPVFSQPEAKKEEPRPLPKNVVNLKEL